MPWMVVEQDGKQERLAVKKTAKGVWVGYSGGSVFIPKTLKFASGKQLEDDNIVAPMTGKVIRVNAEVGQDVEKEEVLVLLEAMKMEYRLSAPRAGVVSGIFCEPGDLVDLGKLLVTLDTE
tara:strand:+ start:82 stop:444 length:363 start_codon:yes stop_codon:yes gene_type:complete